MKKCSVWIALLVAAGQMLSGSAYAQSKPAAPLQAVPEPEKLLVPNRDPVPIAPENWFRDTDLPECRFGGCSDGRVGFTLIVNAEGRPTDCSITRTSGLRDLDLKTCSILLRRARFDPATNGNGEPKRARYASALRWNLSVSKTLAPSGEALDD